MNRIVIFSAIALALSFQSCNQTPPLTPADKEMLKEKMALCQIVEDYPAVVDVFGDTVRPGKYYVLTQKYELVPVMYKGVLATNKDDIKIYLASLESGGNLWSDTMTVALAIGGPKVILRVYALKGLEVADISLL